MHNIQHQFAYVMEGQCSHILQCGCSGKLNKNDDGCELQNLWPFMQLEHRKPRPQLCSGISGHWGSYGFKRTILWNAKSPEDHQ